MDPAILVNAEPMRVRELHDYGGCFRFIHDQSTILVDPRGEHGPLKYVGAAFRENVRVPQHVCVVVASYWVWQDRLIGNL
jgi:hypothetical protein